VLRAKTVMVASVQEIEDCMCRLEDKLGREEGASVAPSAAAASSRAFEMVQGSSEFTISSVATCTEAQRAASVAAFGEDAELAALYGALLCVQGLFLQHYDRQDDAGASFVNAEPFLQAALFGPPGSAAPPRPTRFDGIIRRFYMSCLVYAGQVERALAVGEDAVRRSGAVPAAVGTWRLLGEICNVRASSQPEGAEQRAASFGRAKEAFAQAHELEPGPKCTYISWAFSYAMLSDEEGSRQVAERAIERCRGFWVHPLQRPSHMLPGLKSSPWHGPEDFPWIQRLEDNWRTIRAELDALDAASEDGGGAWPEVRGHDRSLSQGSGVWREFCLLGLDGETEARARRRCPLTCRLLAEVEAIRSHRDLREKEETALFSRLTPGTHLKAHCGPTNTHLTCHLGLRVPPGCRLRAGAETRTWEEGRCLVFDDSFEHEVWHEGGGARVVLLLRFWHPELPPAKREAAMEEMKRAREDKSWLLA